jgi:hypothetical protein
MATLADIKRMDTHSSSPHCCSHHSHMKGTSDINRNQHCRLKLETGKKSYRLLCNLKRLTSKS